MGHACLNLVISHALLLMLGRLSEFHDSSTRGALACYHAVTRVTTYTMAWDFLFYKGMAPGKIFHF